MGFLANVLGISLIYAAWGVASGLLVGSLRMLTLGTAVIAGTAAYTFAQAGSEPAAWAGALTFGAAAGMAMTLVALRAREHDFALATFALVLAWQSFVASANPLTGGAFGVSSAVALPAPWGMDPSIAFAACAVLLFLVSLLLALVERRRRVGIAAAMTGRSQEFARSLGVPVTALLLAYGASTGAVFGLGAGLLAAYIGYVGPTLLTISTSVLVLALGLAWTAGPRLFAVAVVATVALPELLRVVGSSSVDSAALRVTLSGAALLFLGLTTSRRWGIR